MSSFTEVNPIQIVTCLLELLNPIKINKFCEKVIKQISEMNTVVVNNLEEEDYTIKKKTHDTNEDPNDSSDSDDYEDIQYDVLDRYIPHIIVSTDFRIVDGYLYMNKFNIYPCAKKGLFYLRPYIQDDSYVMACNYASLTIKKDYQILKNIHKAKKNTLCTMLQNCFITKVELNLCPYSQIQNTIIYECNYEKIVNELFNNIDNTNEKSDDYLYNQIIEQYDEGFRKWGNGEIDLSYDFADKPYCVKRRNIAHDTIHQTKTNMEILMNELRFTPPQKKYPGGVDYHKASASFKQSQKMFSSTVNDHVDLAQSDKRIDKRINSAQSDKPVDSSAHHNIQENITSLED